MLERKIKREPITILYVKSSENIIIPRVTPNMILKKSKGKIFVASANLKPEIVKYCAKIPQTAELNINIKSSTVGRDINFR